MQLNPIRSMLGRRLRLAVIGGGPGSFIGARHRQAARLDDRYEIITGILSSGPEKSKQAGQELGWDSRRLYSSVQEMLEGESLHKKVQESRLIFCLTHALYFPNSWDGLLGVRFVNSVIESSNASGKWVKC